MENQVQQKEYKVQFFGLKNDGDSAIVRFPYKNESEIDADVVKVHYVDVNGKQRKIGCIRNISDPIDKCPLCASNNQASTRLFVRVLSYVPQANGSVKPQAGIWERPVSFSETLKGKMRDIAALTGSSDLSNRLFKITRHGAAQVFGAQASSRTKVTYDIELAVGDIYKPEIFIPNFTDFADFSLANTFYWVKTAEEMVEFIKTGKFPYNKPVQQAPVANQTFTPSVAQAAPVVSTIPAGDPYAPTPGVTISNLNTAPVQQPVTPIVTPTPVQPIVVNTNEFTTATPIGQRYNY